nr:hypothetical protein [Mycoplasmopsis bovis]QQH18994.1 hypothetical protein HYE48_00950 [Mycoplasmopsis bovis]
MVTLWLATWFTYDDAITKHYAKFLPKYIADEIIKKRNIQLKDEDVDIIFKATLLECFCYFCVLTKQMKQFISSIFKYFKCW